VESLSCLTCFRLHCEHEYALDALRLQVCDSDLCASMMQNCTNIDSMSDGGVGARIKKRREKLGMSQAQLAALCGFSQSSVARIESGSTTDPRGATINKIAEALGVSPAWLQTGAEEHSAEIVLVPSETPTLGNLPGYGPLEHAARRIAKDVEPWVWLELRASNPLFSARVPLTPLVLANLARIIAECGIPPAGGHTTSDQK